MNSWPDNPVLVEAWRSGFLESVHRGALVVLDADGGVRDAHGAVDRPVLPRSSNKPVQATALLAAGWQPRSQEELAIGAASHNGEDGHRDLVAGMLAAAGLGPDDLGCPPALPMHEATRARWLVEGRAPDRLAMNCSGKHAAMLAACVASGWPTEGYLERDHPLQQAIEARLAESAEEPVEAVVVDGCGAPQHALTLTGLARGVLSLV
jgi:L-asparaginase II